MATWIEADPRNTTARQVVRDRATKRLPEWERPGDVWQIAQTTTRAIMVVTREDAVAWFLNRLGELVDAGLYDEVFPSAAPVEVGTGGASI